MLKTSIKPIFSICNIEWYIKSSIHAFFISALGCEDKSTLLHFIHYTNIHSCLTSSQTDITQGDQKKKNDIANAWKGNVKDNGVTASVMYKLYWEPGHSQTPGKKLAKQELSITSIVNGILRPRPRLKSTRTHSRALTREVKVISFTPNIMSHLNTLPDGQHERMVTGWRSFFLRTSMFSFCLCSSFRPSYAVTSDPPSFTLHLSHLVLRRKTQCYSDKQELWPRPNDPACFVFFLPGGKRCCSRVALLQLKALEFTVMFHCEGMREFVGDVWRLLAQINM